jgi:hypothetical protein
MRIRLFLPGLILPFFLTACASSHRNVARTLDKYQPGVTTWNEFTKDAKVTQERPVPQAQAQYLNSPAPVPIKVWVAQRDPWRIYEQRETVSTDKTEVVVGDDKRPLALLTFTGETLSDKRQL